VGSKVCRAFSTPGNHESTDSFCPEVALTACSVNHKQNGRQKYGSYCVPDNLKFGGSSLIQVNFDLKINIMSNMAFEMVAFANVR